MKTIVATSFIIGAILIFFFYTEDKRAEIKLAKAEILEYKDALKQSEEVLKRKGELEEKYASFKKEDVDNLQKLLPDHVDNIQLVMDINNIARKYGMALKAVEMESGPSESFATSNVSQGGEGDSSVSVSFSVSSQYDVFVRFMKDLEKSLRIVDVTGLVFATGEKNIYDFDLTIKTYWLK